MTVADTLKALDATRDETLRYYALNDRDLAKSYGLGKWSVHQLLHHLADAETVMAERIRRVIGEGRQVLWVFDEDKWARALEYGSMPLELSRDIYRATRAGTRYLVATFYESHGAMEWVHSATGVRTLQQEMDKVASHNEHHLAQIRQALQ